MNDVFKALADPTRREILLLLAQKPEHVNAISEKFEMSRPAVSKHIKVLRSCNLVKIESDDVDARQRICHLQLEAIQDVNDYLEKLEKFWRMKLDGLGAYLESN